VAIFTEQADMLLRVQLAADIREKNTTHTESWSRRSTVAC